MRLQVGAATSVGRVRAINEDAFLASADRGVFVVCDGMGGTAGGEVASRIAVDTISARTMSELRDLRARGGFQPRTEQLGLAIEDANHAIVERAKVEPQHAGMGTTVVGIWVHGHIVSVAHVGDSRAYLRTESGFEAMTVDHSLVEAQVQAGLIDREHSLQSQQQNVLLRALGREPEVDVELNEMPVADGDRLLLCTDGLTRTVSVERMADILTSFRGDPQGACDRLIAEANANGGPDNVTVVVVDVHASRLSQVFERLSG